MNDELYELIDRTIKELLKLRDEHPFCAICGKPTHELYVYTFPLRGHFWAQWVCYECYGCYEKLEVSEDD